MTSWTAWILLHFYFPQHKIEAQDPQQYLLVNFHMKPMSALFPLHSGIDSLVLLISFALSLGHWNHCLGFLTALFHFGLCFGLFGCRFTCKMMMCSFLSILFILVSSIIDLLVFGLAGTFGAFGLAFDFASGLAFGLTFGTCILQGKSFVDSEGSTLEVEVDRILTFLFYRNFSSLPAFITHFCTQTLIFVSTSNLSLLLNFSHIWRLFIFLSWVFLFCTISSF